MQLEDVLDVAAVDEVVDLAVRVAGDVGQHGAARRLLVQPVDRHHGEELVDRPGVGQRLEHGEVAEVGVRRAPLEPLELLRHLAAGSRAMRRIFWQIAQKMSSATHALLQRQVPEVEQLQALVLVLERRRDRPRAGSCATPRGRSRRGCAATRSASAGDLRGSLPTSNSPTPSTSMTSTAWCATMARPDSETIVGCGTPSASQTSMIAEDDVVGVLLQRVVHRRGEVRLRAVVVDARGRRRRRGSSSGAPSLTSST